MPSISKIIERVIHSQLSEYLESNNLLNDCQFGFRKRRSTELATALFTDKIKKKVNEGKLVGFIFFDVTKAFDAISHAKLISKMRSYGVLNKELECFQDYLLTGLNTYKGVRHSQMLERFVQEYLRGRV